MAAVRTGKLVAVVANGQRASGPAWLVTDHSRNWAQAAFGISVQSPITKPGSAHTFKATFHSHLFPELHTRAEGGPFSFLSLGEGIGAKGFILISLKLHHYPGDVPPRIGE